MPDAATDISAQLLVAIGSILLVGLLLSSIAQRSPLPRATLLLLFGTLIGSGLLDIIPPLLTEHFELIADITLLMVGFLLGGKLTASSLKDHSLASFAISACAALIPALLVCGGMIAMGLAPEIAVLLGCFAAATAPTAVYDVVEEAGVKNRFSELLLLVVILDDIWALLLFGVGLAVVTAANGMANEVSLPLMLAHELGGAVLLGLAIGLPAAFLTGRIKPGKPMLLEALGIVFLCGGLAIWLDVSYLIAAITMGAVIANLARHHSYPFHAIEGTESLFMVVFLVLAGATLDLAALELIGAIGLAYIGCRALGKYLGASLGAILGGTDSASRHWMGIALLPQAGVAIGMALVASSRFPEYRQIMLPIVIASTIVFEIAGPVFTRLAVERKSANRG